MQRGEGGLGGAIEIAAQLRRHLGRDRVLQQIDIALVFLGGHLGPDIRRVSEIGLGLIEKRGDLFRSRDDVADALGFRRVFQTQRIEQRVANQLDVDRGVVPVALDGIEIEQRQLDLAHHDVVIGAIFG